MPQMVIGPTFSCVVSTRRSTTWVGLGMSLPSVVPSRVAQYHSARNKTIASAPVSMRATFIFFFFVVFMAVTSA